MSNERVGDLENEQGFLKGEIENYEEQLAALRADLVKIESDLTQAKVEAFNE